MIKKWICRITPWQPRKYTHKNKQQTEKRMHRCGRTEGCRYILFFLFLPFEQQQGNAYALLITVFYFVVNFKREPFSFITGSTDHRSVLSVQSSATPVTADATLLITTV